MEWSTTVSPAATGVLPWSGTLSGATVFKHPFQERVNLFDPWVKAPVPVSRPAPQAQVLARTILGWTGWSHRGLARVLEISHPTVAALEQGRSTAQVGDLMDRLVEVHEVVRRVHLIADGDVSRTRHLLTTSSESDEIAMELLSDRRPAEAYLAALDALRPRRSGLMMQSVWPARAGEATVDLAEGSV